MGVYAPKFVRPIADALARLGSVHALVLHSDDGLDEISIGAPTTVAQVRDGVVREWSIDPRALGLEMVDPMSLAPDSLDAAVRMLTAVIDGEDRGPRRTMVLLNAAAALLVADIAPTLEEGITMSAESIDRGSARATLDALRACSQG
jgi:anthranilate phosphoribosyltransferase